MQITFKKTIIYKIKFPCDNVRLGMETHNGLTHILFFAFNKLVQILNYAIPKQLRLVRIIGFSPFKESRKKKIVRDTNQHKHREFCVQSDSYRMNIFDTRNSDIETHFYWNS